MSYRFLEHVGEVELDLEAQTEAGLFEAALAAFHELVDGDDPGGEPAAHELELAGDERALLLADWLGELVFLAEVERFVPERVASLALGEAGLRAGVTGRRGFPRHLVKAVTLSGLRFEERDGVWHAHVVLDV